MGSPVIWLSGAQQDVLARFKGDRPKYAGMGSAVLITATMAGVSMTFALHSALKAPLATAIPFAVAWGFAIMTLDRWLVVSLVGQENKLNYLVVALPRVALAILFGLVISTPFTLQIFQPEISQQITVIQKQREASYYASLATDPLTKRIEADQARVTHDEAVIGASSGAAGSQATDPVLSDLERQLAQDRRQEDSDYAKWRCELYGLRACAAGNGPVAQADAMAYSEDVRKVNHDNANISARQQVLSRADAASAANGRRDLEPDKARLAADRATQASLEKAFLRANSSNAGLLLRLQALDQAAAGSGILQAARWLLFLLFTAIECLPVLVKVLLNLGPPTSYEKALALVEQAGLQLAEEETRRQRQQATLAGDALSDEIERLHAEWRTNALPAIIHDTTAARERVVRSKLAQWERRQAASNGDGLNGLGDLLGTGHLTGPEWPSRQRAARQAHSRVKDPRQSGPKTSAWPYWPDSL